MARVLLVSVALVCSSITLVQNIEHTTNHLTTDASSYRDRYVLYDIREKRNPNMIITEKLTGAKKYIDNNGRSRTRKDIEAISEQRKMIAPEMLLSNSKTKGSIFSSKRQNVVVKKDKIKKGPKELEILYTSTNTASSLEAFTINKENINKISKHEDETGDKTGKKEVYSFNRRGFVISPKTQDYNTTKICNTSAHPISTNKPTNIDDLETKEIKQLDYSFTKHIPKMREESKLFTRTKRIHLASDKSDASKDAGPTLAQKISTVTDSVNQKDVIDSRSRRNKGSSSANTSNIVEQLTTTRYEQLTTTDLEISSDRKHMTDLNGTESNTKGIDHFQQFAKRTNLSVSPNETGSIFHLTSLNEQTSFDQSLPPTKHITTEITAQTISNHKIRSKTTSTPIYDGFARKFINQSGKTSKLEHFNISQINILQLNDNLLNATSKLNYSFPFNGTNQTMVSPTIAADIEESGHKLDEAINVLKLNMTVLNGNVSIDGSQFDITNMSIVSKLNEKTSDKSKLDATTYQMDPTSTFPSVLDTTNLQQVMSLTTVPTLNISDFESWDFQNNFNFFDDVTATPVTSASLNASGTWPVKHSAVVEGDLILGGLMMVHEREDSITCGPIMPQGGVQALEAMLYTLDRINENQTILPNVTIGAHILDDCDKDTYGLEMAVDFIKGSISNIDGAEYHCNKTQIRKVISGVVGAASSVTSIQVANLLRLFKIPQVSFFSTSPELSNKQRFEFFSRTIPSDHYQVKAMVDIVRLLNWSYVSIIYEESNYGIKAFEELEDLLQKYDICIAVKEKLVKDSGVAGEKAYDIIVQKLLTKPRARGAIVFGSDQEVAGVMRAVRRSNATGSFSWIGSDGWSARSLVSDGNEAEVEGTLSVQPQANPVQGFEEYFLGLTVENNRRNPWFVEFWEDHFHCRYPNSSKTPYNIKYKRLCTTREQLSKQNTVFEDQLQFVSDAVMAFAYAIRDMHKVLCNGRPGLCDAMKPTKGTELLKYLHTVDFQGLSGDWFRFDVNGDGPARYNIIHFKQVTPGKYRWIRVGEYIEGALNLNMSEIQFKLSSPKPPESVCSLPCDQGQAKKYVEGEMCCWHCFNCTQYQIRHPNDETQCEVCLPGTLPDSAHVYCNDIPEEFLRPESGWAIGAMALSFTGIFVTMFVAGVFIRFNDTPVVRASGRELSYILLAGILMCYCVTFALVMKPTDAVCGIQRFSTGFCFTVVYAALLTKTNRISRIFNAGKHSAKRPSFISPRSQLIICSFMVFVQMLINGVWMLLSPARAIHHYPTREDNLLVCSSHVDASYMIAFTYPIFLIVICTIYAVLTRKIPEAFNESKHIGFTMYTTCVIWLAFVPLYFGTANNVALRITSMSVTISLSASVTVACLFSPKLYIILIRPERNVRQSMMPVRYSAINKSSGTTNSGAGSMMAAVRVTAATCNQQSQIQKHVPETKDNIELNANSNAKPTMVDNSTQTIPPPPLNGNLQGTDAQEQKNNNTSANNNCTPLGNGPLLTQLKDVTL